MKAIPHKYHHFVPQCYLRNFGHNKDSKGGYFINTYSKNINKAILMNIDNVCGEDFFYSLPDEYIRQHSIEDLNSLSIEIDYFASNIESEYNSILTNIFNSIKLTSDQDIAIIDISDKDKFTLAKQIVVQYLRLPEVRTYDTELSDFYDNNMITLFQEGLAKELNNPEIAKLKIVSKRDKIVNHAFLSFMNKELISSFANDLAKNIWTFYYSEEGKFYTCDSPVFAYGYVKNVRQENMGLTRYGVDTSIALNPHLTLSIRDYRYFNKIKNNIISRVSDEQLRHYNIIRFSQAKKYIFSFDNDFELIKTLNNITKANGKA